VRIAPCARAGDTQMDTEETNTQPAAALPPLYPFRHSLPKHSTLSRIFTSVNVRLRME
jgi:hypothetical protein